MPMAASYHQNASNTPLHNRIIQNENTTEIKLPSGSCNFRNLSNGGNAARCGCKRFWDQSKETFGAFGNISQGRPGFCMCEHHACYHDEVSESSATLSDLTKVEAKQLQYVSIPQRPNYSGQGSVSVATSDSGRPPSTIPDTLQYNRYMHTGSSLKLPAIPSQCLLPSDNGSMTSGSQERYTRPFGGIGLDTMSHIIMSGSGKPMSVLVKASQPEERKMHVFRDNQGNEFLQSLTEVATPSAQASPGPTESEHCKDIANIQTGLDQLAEKRSQGQTTTLRPVSKGSVSAIKQSASHPGVDLAAIPSECDDDEYLIPRLRSLIGQFSDFPNKVQNHERRLELLENSSFTNPALDELHDADDRMETRVCDIEDRIIEIEKVHAAFNDASSVGSKQLVDSSFGSRVSVTSSAMIASAISRVDPARFEALEAQIAELQAAALPSYFRPWEVEVVFLPFGSGLMGLWSTQHTSIQRLRIEGSSNACTPTQHNSLAAAQVQLVKHDHASAWERFASDPEQDDATWSMARACGKGSRVDERLRSRGFVKTIQIMGPDARDVQAAMLAAFGDLPEQLKEDLYSVPHENAGTVPDHLRNSLGLQSSWVPLRKVHKDSCLRFLNPSEMATQALWTVPFLTSSVAMRQKDIKRLYVTQSDSYIQHLGSHTADWTWQKLKRLPRVSNELDTQENEPCWNFDDRLDHIEESFHSSFASDISSLSIRSPILGNHEPTSQSDHFSSGPASSSSTSIAPTVAFPSSPIQERHPFRPVRGHSMSSAVPLRTSQPIKRRITSFEQETHPHSRTPSTATNYMVPKRQRISRSPSRPRDTPRYSEGAPSPYNYMDEVPDKRNDRLTPFAYATPHSNAPYVEHAHARSAIGIFEDEDAGSVTDDMDADHAEANALSDSGSDEAKFAEQERFLDEEWQGMGDDEDRAMVFEPPKYLQTELEDDGDAASSVGAPSEYPSKQRPVDFGPPKAGFRIHIDEEVDEEV